MLLNVRIPNEPFNAAVKKGTAGQTMNNIIEEAKPEAVYFTEQDGVRCAMIFVNVENPSQIPQLAEPWFLNFNATCEFRVVMSPDDLQRAGLDKLGEKWK